MNAKVYTVTRDVAADEKHNWLGRAAYAGERFYEFTGTTWGSVDFDGGIALCTDEPGAAFFEFPADAVVP